LRGQHGPRVREGGGLAVGPHPQPAVTAVVASVIGDPLVYVSGGAEHQGPGGGGPVAAIVRRGA